MGFAPVVISVSFINGLFLGLCVANILHRKSAMSVFVLICPQMSSNVRICLFLRCFFRWRRYYRENAMSRF